jgi:hypothetical protein
MVSLDLAKADDKCWRRHIVKTLADKKIHRKMLHFVCNFMDNRTFKVVLGAESSRKTHTENGVVHGAVISVIMFLVALANIVKQVELVEIVGYADDWAIFTSNQDMEIAQTNIQSSLKNLSKWTRRKGFMISLEKTIAMHICRKRNHDHPDPQIRLNGQILEVKNTHKILAITFDNRLTWKAHITEAKAKAAKRMKDLRSSAGTN